MVSKDRIGEILEWWSLKADMHHTCSKCESENG